MALLGDFLKELLLKDRTGLPPTNDLMSRSPSELGTESADSGSISPDVLMQQAQKPPPGTISNDAGSLVDFNPGNPFAKLVDKNAEQGTLRNFLGRIFDNGQLTPGTGTVGGGGAPDHVPGTEQDAALNPTPMEKQKQRSFAPVDDTPPVGPNGAPTSELDANALKAYADKTYDYSQPTALDPVAIEQLRKSLLTQAGQLDPNNPNGLSGRMNSPNAPAEQRNQMDETQRMGDQLRGSANSIQNDRRNEKRSSLDPYRVAGDVVPIRPAESGWNLMGAIGQMLNDQHRTSGTHSDRTNITPI